MHWVGCELHLSGRVFRHERSSIMTHGRGPAASARGRPRDPTLDARILDQVLALLASHGYAGLTLDELASRSGVAKTTILRRWPSHAARPAAGVERLGLPRRRLPGS